MCVFIAPSMLGAFELRIAYYNAELKRKGPGLLLRDIERGDAQIMAARDVIARIDPDILVLGSFDWDAKNRALHAFAKALAQKTRPYAHLFAGRPNSGMATVHDLDGDGRLGGPRDSQGFGYFTGQGALAILSRMPFDESKLQDFTALRWADFPDALLPTDANGAPFPSPEAQAAQRLSSTAHWSLPVITPKGALTLLAYAAGPPVFDGPEDMNGRRNHDETALWLKHLDGKIGDAPRGPFVLLGGSNLDPADGDGRRAVMRALLAHPALQDPRPESAGGAEAATAGQLGNPALDTADWAEPHPGNMRVDYVLPSADLAVRDAGVFWPTAGSADHALALRASRHRLVWVDLQLE